MMATSIKATSDEPGGSLAGRISGSAGAPLAVFFHGVGGHRLSWDPQLSWDPRLSALGGLRWCLACDLPWYGRSPGRPSALPELASIAADWIADLGGGPIDVVGRRDAFRTKPPDVELQRLFDLGCWSCWPDL
jgi:pimeloyl-ACP methyl ester carboxylesterase